MDEQNCSHFPSFATMPRRDFLKLAGEVGISAIALEALISCTTPDQTAKPHVSPTHVTNGLIGYWPLDDAKGHTATDTSGNGYHGTLINGPTWTSGKSGTALSFNGKNTAVAINHSVVDTSKSFSVAAWLHLSDLNNWHTALSQDGTHISGFFLQYTSPDTPNDGGKFAFSLVNADSTSGTTVRATSNFTPLASTWYHVVGVYDATNKQSKLYVNGVLQSIRTVPAAWNATGTMAIGHARWNAAPIDFWEGLIDDVRVYNLVLSDQQVASLYQAAPTISPIRAPAVPLIVRNPYVSTWQASNTAPGTWSTFWNGNIKALTGIARIDDTPYVFFGAPANIGSVQPMTQQQLEITATQSRYVFQAGGVTLYLTFLSPVEATDIQRLSMPFAYIMAQAHSHDGRIHTVNLYFDISGEWAHGTSSTPINWAMQHVPYAGGTLSTFVVTPSSPTPLAETNDYPSWGQVIWATNARPHLSYQSGADTVVRSQFVSHGTLNNAMDTDMPRAINNRWPVFAFKFALGSVDGQSTAPLVLALGHVRQPAVSYQGKPIAPLWRAYWSGWPQMLAFFYSDASAALNRANTLDNTIASAAVSAGGATYAALCTLATRQAFAGMELVNTPADPWLFLKEISSDGDISTVDVLYPSFPILYYFNPSLLKLLLAPILSYVESGLWPQLYCVHDLGTYPNARGHNEGGGENMPVEETANMLIMAAAYIQQARASDAASYSQTHYKIFKQWADYLNTPNGNNPVRVNALDPLFQNQTDDFTGLIAHSTNLALKAIIALGAMAIIAQSAGNSADQQFYSSTALALMKQWAQLSKDTSQAHLDIAYSELDTALGTGQGTYSLKYNAFPDQLLGLNLLPASVLQEEANWYNQHKNPYGIPLDSRHTYSKADWQLWTAASTNVASLRQFFIDALYHFYNTSSSRVPMTDWYDTNVGTQTGFQARPVVGGFYSVLALLKIH